MSGVSTYAANQMLNWALTAASAVPGQALQWAVGISTVIPSSTRGGDLLGDAQYVRRLCTFSAWSGGSIINLTSCSFGTFGATYTFFGFGVYDTVSTGQGNLIYFNTFAGGSSVLPRRTGFSLSPAALVISLS